jgi:hypothetical protein
MKQTSVGGVIQIFANVGVILSVSRHSDRPKQASEAPPTPDHPSNHATRIPSRSPTPTPQSD